MILERAERGGECGMFNIPDAFFGHIFLSLHLFFISQSWNFIIDDMTLFQSYYYMYVHTHAYNVLGQIMYFKSIGIITSHKFSNFILNTWSLICLNLPILSHKKMEKKVAILRIVMFMLIMKFQPNNLNVKCIWKFRES